ncbi:transcriptional regulator, AsnC family [Pseudooceanicola antarcticus]|uniref:Proline dehydrogenase transcriptional activator n=1 Tax=Pseudooceanicola antarcticus TaxID=1247613 RepID=A0A285HTY0_9RHOB|nr:Lrp/AsnC ligand binding domain-containing protein [Pseudooceanicola antarcticus]PJE27529.1 proline dehydrogenase transcriptional activator [Pseudooceanicola antarcticus]SNY39139.1 transcriptional regulator, AsnC family [Pseudooceanicola antarcticus]
MSTEELDSVDRKILAELTGNARIPVTELARKVGLSKTPVAARLKALEESGVITGYRASLSPIKLGLTHVSFVEVRLSDTRQKALEEFNAAVRRVSEIEECYMIAGGFDYLIKVRSRDMTHYRQIMADVISALPYMASTSTYVAMEAVVEASALTP